MSGSQISESGFTVERHARRRIASRATNAAAASFAVVMLSLSLAVALAAVSIKVMAATPIAG